METDLADAWWWLLSVGQVELMVGGILHGGVGLGLILVGAATVLAVLAGYMKGAGAIYGSPGGGVNGAGGGEKMTEIITGIMAISIGIWVSWLFVRHRQSDLRKQILYETR